MPIAHDSRSARAVALLRALHQTLVPERRIHHDPFAPMCFAALKKISSTPGSSHLEGRGTP